MSGGEKRRGKGAEAEIGERDGGNGEGALKLKLNHSGECVALEPFLDQKAGPLDRLLACLIKILIVRLTFRITFYKQVLNNIQVRVL